LIPQILPGVFLGVPIGAFLIRRVRPDTFRRLCMSFDAWIVAFGIATQFRDLGIVPGNAAYLVMALVGLLDGSMLYRFFTARARSAPASANLKSAV